MKFSSLFSFAFLGTILTACSSTSSFKQSDLKPEIYQGYWAMQPVNDQYRVVKFETGGAVKIYDYTCDFQDHSYRLNETETVYLSRIKENTFNLLDSKKKAFAKFEILQLNAQKMQAKQSFDKERPLILNYTRLQGAKPLC